MSRIDSKNRVNNHIIYQIWTWPKWTAYAIAISSPVLVTLGKLIFKPIVGDPGPFLYYVLAIAVSAVVGGWWPGILAMTLSAVLATYIMPSSLYFLPPGTMSSQEPQLQMLVSFLISWVFICWICQFVRSAALNEQQATLERNSAQASLDRLLDRSADGFLAFGPDGRVLHSNPAFEEIMALGKLDLSLLKKDKIVSDANLGNISLLKSALDSDQIYTRDVELNDQQKWVNIRSFPDSDGVSIFVQDITIRKAIEENREHLLTQEIELRNEAEESSRLRDEFLATTSHELRTPLTTILGWSEILQRRNTQPELRDGLAAIEQSAKIQVQLINDLLDMSRLMAGNLGLELEIIEVCEAINFVIGQCLPIAQEKGVKLEEVCEDEQLFIKADSERFAQIFSILISNSIKFSPSGATIVIKCCLDSSSTILVTVEDEGEGIDSKAIEHIFKRFRQVNSSISRRQGGLGLGLAIAKDLVESHGGTILAESEGLGKGTKFKLTFPAANIEQKMTENIALNQSAAADLTGVSILLVDDDPGTQLVIAALLKEAGASVKVVGSGEQALISVAEETPQVIVSDIGMPEMNGYELVQRLRLITEKLGDGRPRLLALTAFVSPSEKSKAIGAGFDNYLEKPVDSVRLRNMIRTLVDQ